MTDPWYRSIHYNGRVVKEHIVIAEKAFGGPLPKGAVVHHADGNRSNNDPSNLVICPDQRYHLFLHARINAKKACGNPDWRMCRRCKEHDDIKNLKNWRDRKQTHYVHRECHNDYKRDLKIRKERG